MLRRPSTLGYHRPRAFTSVGKRHPLTNACHAGFFHRIAETRSRTRTKRPRAQRGGVFHLWEPRESGAGAAAYQRPMAGDGHVVKCHAEALFAPNPHWQGPNHRQNSGDGVLHGSWRYPLCGHGLAGEPDQLTLAGVEGLESDRAPVSTHYSGGGAAVDETDRGVCKLSKTILSFSSSVHRRRRPVSTASNRST